MSRLHTILIGLFTFGFYFLTFSQEASIYVRDARTKAYIPHATINIRGVIDNGSTEDDGELFLIGIEKGTYDVEIIKDGYAYFLSRNPIKITDRDNIFDFYLEPLPKDVYTVSGRVVEDPSRDPIQDVSVQFIQNKTIGTTKTNAFGYYYFEFPGSKIIPKQDFQIDLKHSSYRASPTIKRGFLQRNLTLPPQLLTPNLQPPSPAKGSFNWIPGVKSKKTGHFLLFAGFSTIFVYGISRIINKQNAINQAITGPENEEYTSQRNRWVILTTISGLGIGYTYYLDRQKD